MRFFRTAEFVNKDLKNLVKKYRSLPEDLEVLEKFLAVEPKGHEPLVYPISLREVKLILPAFKVEHFRCRSLGGGSRSGIRVIYSYYEEQEAILFIEIYYKDRDHRECDVSRLAHYCECNWYIVYKEAIEKKN